MSRHRPCAERRQPERRLLAGSAAGLAVLFVAACAGTERHHTLEVEVHAVSELPASPDDPAWRTVPVHRAELVLQDLVEPRQLEPTTPYVDVQAATDGPQLALRLQWPDPTVDELPGASRFTDACAVQLPAQVASNVPAPQMGEPGGAVEITYWRATWQSSVNGRGDNINELYPAARVDHYPFEAASLDQGSPQQLALADQYSPARALGNAMEGPRSSSVEDLVAEGPGSLTRSPTQRSTGFGSRSAEGWQVLLVRKMPEALAAGARTQIAFAVWDGAQHEVGARKMRSIWTPLHLVATGESP